MTLGYMAFDAPKKKKVRGRLRFGRRVDGVERERRHDDAGAGSDVDDGAPPPGGHHRQQGARDPRGGLDVHPYQGLPHEALHLVEVCGARVRGAGVVDEDADVAALHGGRHARHPAPRVVPGDGEVERHAAHLARRRGGQDLLGHPRQLLGAPPHEDEVEARARQLQRHRAADAVRGAGHHRPRPVPPGQVPTRAQERAVEPEEEGGGGPRDGVEADGDQGGEPRGRRGHGPWREHLIVCCCWHERQQAHYEFITTLGSLAYVGLCYK